MFTGNTGFCSAAPLSEGSAQLWQGEGKGKEMLYLPIMTNYIID